MHPARHTYHDKSVFQDELSRLFNRRLFIGATQDFASLDCYRSFQLGRHALTSRATPEGVRTFSNVCLHRNSLIDPPGSGQRPFRCSYHGWSYHADGSLKHAPYAEIACLHHRRLSSFPIAEAGQLHFAGINGITPLVDEVPELLQKVGVGIDTAFHQSELAHECNWKLLVENVLEGYHLNFIHENSLIPAGLHSATPAEIGYRSYTSWCLARPEASPIMTGLKHLPGARHQYLHGYIFPNVLVANTNNLVGYLGELQPLSADRTLLRWRLLELPALRALPENMREYIRQEAVASCEKVLQEDKHVVESCQRGLESEGTPPQLQPCEERIMHFHQIYAEMMKQTES
ncbi:MAG: hypothetical protein K0Q68_270 [Moraxellaceae bacterium]|jgi:phenylpropionate dioxygenase-like ring-hydroxylating dioxygenase large terminal subunit|nr:hypothetical protein [Moraxellaceae bacterium]